MFKSIKYFFAIIAGLFILYFALLWTSNGYSYAMTLLGIKKGDLGATITTTFVSNDDHVRTLKAMISNDSDINKVISELAKVKNEISNDTKELHRQAANIRNLEEKMSILEQDLEENPNQTHFKYGTLNAAHPKVFTRDEVMAYLHKKSRDLISAKNKAEAKNAVIEAKKRRENTLSDQLTNLIKLKDEAEIKLEELQYITLIDDELKLESARISSTKIDTTPTTQAIAIVNDEINKRNTSIRESEIRRDSHNNNSGIDPTAVNTQKTDAVSASKAARSYVPQKIETYDNISVNNTNANSANAQILGDDYSIEPK